MSVESINRNKSLILSQEDYYFLMNSSITIISMVDPSLLYPRTIIKLCIVILL